MRAAGVLLICSPSAYAQLPDRESLPLTLQEDSGTRVTGSVSLDDRAELFRYGLEAAGFTVHEGEFAIFEVDDCGLVPHCWANNPTSPYGLFRVPAAHDEPDPDPEGRYQIGDGYSAFCRLQPDEAIVFIGTTPPTSPYFSFTGYVFSRWNPGSTGAPPYDDRVEVFGSLGDSLNQLVLQTSAGPGEGPWNKETVVVFTADRNTELSIRQELTDAGFPGSVVNTLVIPRFEADGVTPLARMGYANEDDVFTVLARIAHPDATVQGTPIRQWLDAPAGRLFRVRPVAQTPLDPIPFPPLRPTGTGQSESGQSLSALVLNIRQRYASSGTLVTSFSPATWEDGYSCIKNMYPCLADCRDTPYLLAVTRLGPWESVIVAGYNHERSGKASYVNITATRLSDQRAFYSVVMGDLVGSADVYLPSHPDRQNLWQAVFRRSCLGQPYCFEVNPEQVPFDQAFSLLVRAYLEPPTRTSPKALPHTQSEIVFPRLIRVSGIPGDYDMDGDVDLDDFEIFKSCVSGPAVPRAQTPVCLAADFDADGDVDLDDFGIFQRCYSGEGVPADPNCAD